MNGEGGVRYRFGPRERGGALAGWRTGQILTVALGLLFRVVALRWEPNVVGVAAAIGILVLYGALATVPVGGRTGDEWLPVALCWAARRSRGGWFHRGGARREPAPVLQGMSLLRAGWRDMGVVHDRRARTLTAALAVRGASFALLGADEQDRRVGGWASVLGSLAREGSPVRRVQWVASSFPDNGEGVRSYLAAEAASEVAGVCAASYESLLDDMDSRTRAHDVVVTLQVRLTRSVEVGCATLAREVESLSRVLADADVEVESVLGPEGLAHLLLRTYEPRPYADGAALWSSDPWPMAMAESWSSVRVDGMVHATFWVAEWPRVEVRSDFLAPLLLGSARCTVSVVMEPLGSDAAVRKVEASRTASLADAELRRRGGFVSTARHARESEVLARREAELAEGHASFRFSGYVTVSAPERRGAGHGRRFGPARSRPEQAGAAPALRRPGLRVHLHPAPVSRPAVTDEAGGAAERHPPTMDLVATFVLPRIPASAGALIFDEQGRLLVVNPTYKAHWSLPGGIMEADGETPWEACQREVLEEVGLRVDRGSLVVVDFLGPKASKPGGIRFLFDCGAFAGDVLGTITLQEEELSEHRLVQPADALELLSGPLRRRVGAAMAADGCVYLEDGRPV